MRTRNLMPEKPKTKITIYCLSVSAFVLAALFTGLYYFAFKSIDPFFIASSILFVLLPFILLTAAVKTNKRYLLLISTFLVIGIDVIQLLTGAGLLRPEFHFDMLLYKWPIVAQILVILTIIKLVKIRIIAIIATLPSLIFELYGTGYVIVDFINSAKQFGIKAFAFDSIEELFGSLAWVLYYIALLMVLKVMILREPKRFKESPQIED